MKNVKFELVYPDTLKIGDTIICRQGELKSVGKNDIKFDVFMSCYNIKGDIYRFGKFKKEQVKKVILNNHGCIVYE